MIENIIQNLKSLSTNHSVVGLKHSLEDEGSSFDDLIMARRITDICGLNFFVKIGGCEAKTDINNCVKYGVDNVIAPMVESSFALSKFTNTMSLHRDWIKSYIVIESKTAYENLEDILKFGCDTLEGIVVGRSDFSKSYEMDKSSVNSQFIFDKVRDILVKSKKYNYSTTLGGNISTESVDFIRKMYSNNLLDKIETRNVVIKLTTSNVNTLENTIRAALDYEILIMEYKRYTIELTLHEFNSRIKSLNNRQQ